MLEASVECGAKRHTSSPLRRALARERCTIELPSGITCGRRSGSVRSLGDLIYQKQFVGRPSKKIPIEERKKSSPKVWGIIGEIMVLIRRISYDKQG